MSLNFEWDSPDNLTASFVSGLSYLPFCSPTICSLEFQYGSRRNILIPKLVDIIGPLKELRDLTIIRGRSIHPAAPIGAHPPHGLFDVISLLPHLEFLYVDLTLPEDIPVGHAFDPDVRFPALRSLVVARTPLSVVSGFLSRFPVLHLRKLMITISPADPASPHVNNCMLALSKVVSDVVSHDTFQTIVIHVSSQAGTVPMSLDDLHPLCIFQHMMHVHLQTHTLRLDDEDLRVLVMAWPNLQSLFLTGTHREGLEHLTLYSLIHLVTYCPALEDCTIEFDATGEVQLDYHQLPGSGHRNPLIEMLDVGRSCIQDPRAVALFLTDIFPNLETVQTTDCMDAQHVQNWAQVERMLPALRLARQWGRIDVVPGASMEIVS